MLTEEAVVPRAGGRWTAAEGCRVALVATASAVPLYVLWAVRLATGGGDLAAQLAWAHFAARHPVTPYDLDWYGGAHAAAYSLLTPLLMAVCGVRTVTVAAGLVSTWVMSLLLVRAGVRRPLAPALLAAGTLWCDVASGRSTFALGVALGLTALRCEHGLPVALFAGLTAAASPVAALFVAVAGGAYLLTRQWRRALALLLPPAAVVGVVAVLFPSQGQQPMTAGKLTMPLVLCAAVVVAAPRVWRELRAGAALYAAGTVLAFLVASPVGTNVERLAEVAGPPALLAALLSYQARALDPRLQTGPRGIAPPLALVLAVVLGTNWVAGKTRDDLQVSDSVPAWAAHTSGVTAALRDLGAARTRVEVVPARDHREADLLAARIDLARGWNRQLDVARGRLFYRPELAPGAYRAWLAHWAVGLVVLPRATPDGPARTEAALVRQTPAWLRPVWHDRYWSVYRVRDAVPLVSSPGAVVSADDARLFVRMPSAGSVTVRVAFSRWLKAPGACVRRAGQWTRLTVPAPGTYRIGSSYRPQRHHACR